MSKQAAPSMPTQGMEVDRLMLRSALIRHRPNVIAARDAAVIGCAINPEAWYALHGVTLAERLATLDKLEAMCIRAEEEAGEGA